MSCGANWNVGSAMRFSLPSRLPIMTFATRSLPVDAARAAESAARAALSTAAVSVPSRFPPPQAASSNGRERSRQHPYEHHGHRLPESVTARKVLPHATPVPPYTLRCAAITGLAMP